jgi:hypothetical protein
MEDEVIRGGRQRRSPGGSKRDQRLGSCQYLIRRSNQTSGLPASRSPTRPAQAPH